jgi:hypothetical protein
LLVKYAWEHFTIARVGLWSVFGGFWEVHEIVALIDLFEVENDDLLGAAPTLVVSLLR